MTQAEQIDEVIRAYPKDQRYALAALQDMQHSFNYIPEEGLDALATYLGCPVAQLYAMATFYKALSLKPKGRHIIECCDGTACHLRGSTNLVNAVERALDLKPGDTAPDGEFSLELVNCMGACALAPVLVVDGTIHSKVTAEQVPGLIEQHRSTDKVVDGQEA